MFRTYALEREIGLKMMQCTKTVSLNFRHLGQTQGPKCVSPIVMKLISANLLNILFIVGCVGPHSSVPWSESDDGSGEIISDSDVTSDFGMDPGQINEYLLKYELIYQVDAAYSGCDGAEHSILDSLRDKYMFALVFHENLWIESCETKEDCVNKYMSWKNEGHMTSGEYGFKLGYLGSDKFEKIYKWVGESPVCDVKSIEYEIAVGSTESIKLEHRVESLSQDNCWNGEDVSSFRCQSRERYEIHSISEIQD
ncbi:hypothetical protein KKB55_21360 [Myxococcota bacterium]|nr:hypothetical protein [Myxococcota bacterium]MBU1900298.1 hypothetical protein [Myxococcota bacterium]